MNVSNASTIQSDLIYNGSRIFIPITCREVIEKFHDVQQGINALKNLVRNNAWWSFMDSDIEHCQKLCRMQQKQTETDRIYPQMGRKRFVGKPAYGLAL